MMCGAMQCAASDVARAKETNNQMQESLIKSWPNSVSVSEGEQSLLELVAIGNEQRLILRRRRIEDLNPLTIWSRPFRSQRLSQMVGLNEMLVCAD